jgi:hypothetical protein
MRKNVSLFRKAGDMKRTSEQSSNDVQGTSTTTKKPAMDTTDANKNRALRCNSIEKELVFEIDEFSKKTEVIESPIFHGPTNRTTWSLKVSLVAVKNAIFSIYISDIILEHTVFILIIRQLYYFLITLDPVV